MNPNRNRYAWLAILGPILALLAGCSVPPTPITGSTKHDKSSLSSLEEVKAGHDTFGRTWSQTPAPDTVPAVTGPVHAIAYFPSGKLEGSGLSVEKSAPAQALAGQPFEYAYKISNLTTARLEKVCLQEQVSSNFMVVDSDPRADSVNEGNATWTLGAFGPGETKVIKVLGVSPNECTVTTLGYATYTPVLSQEIPVLQGKLQLTLTGPAEALICDAIPITLAVKNIGRSILAGVHVTDSLPAGLAVDGKNRQTFDAGNLAPGESKEFKCLATASAAGPLVITAKASSAEALIAEASATTIIHEPVLALACQAAETQYLGRAFDANFTVTTSGSVVVPGTSLEVAVPPGLTLVSAGSGRLTAGRLVWELGTVGAGNSRAATARFTSSSAGLFHFDATVKGPCGAAAVGSCETRVQGIPAIVLEKSVDPNPVAIGDATICTVRVTNLGTANDHDVQIVVNLAPELAPVSSPEGTINGQTVTLPMVPSLAPKRTITYKILVKGRSEGDGHNKFTLTSASLTSPLTAEASTHVY